MSIKEKWCYFITLFLILFGIAFSIQKNHVFQDEKQQTIRQSDQKMKQIYLSHSFRVRIPKPSPSAIRNMRKIMNERAYNEGAYRENLQKALRDAEVELDTARTRIRDDVDHPVDSDTFDKDRNIANASKANRHRDNGISTEDSSEDFIVWTWYIGIFSTFLIWLGFKTTIKRFCWTKRVWGISFFIFIILSIIDKTMAWWSIFISLGLWILFAILHENAKEKEQKKE